MMVVTLELWPHGDKERRTLLGSCIVANDGTGSRQHGNYIVSVQHGGKYAGRPGNWKAGRVRGFRRTLSPYHLLAACLLAAGIHVPIVQTEKLDPNRPAPPKGPRP